MFDMPDRRQGQKTWACNFHMHMTHMIYGISSHLNSAMLDREFRFSYDQDWTGMFFASFACSEFVGKRLKDMKDIERKQIPAQGPDIPTWLSQSARSSVRVFHPR